MDSIDEMQQAMLDVFIEDYETCGYCDCDKGAIREYFAAENEDEFRVAYEGAVDEFESYRFRDVKDEKLADQGLARILWADKDMPVLASIRETFAQEHPLQGLTVAACMHVTTETANLMRTFKAGGASVHLCASNPLSTQDDVAASLIRDFNIDVHAIKGEDTDTYYEHLHSVIEYCPDVVLDDGADLVNTIQSEYPQIAEGVFGGTEETTTGVVRLQAMASKGELKFPVIAVNNADTKHMFDNRYGTGQSTLDGIIRLTNRLIAGRTVVVSGYGWCGKGLALRAKGMGAQVVICEVDPTAALEAHMEGFAVMPRKEAAKVADIWITVTGNLNVIDEPCYLNMKDGAIICNSGHFNSEINIPWLEENCVEKRNLKPMVDEYVFANGRSIILLAEGRLVNLSGAEGHPANVMDMSFANQALCVRYLCDAYADGKNKSLEKGCLDVPIDIDKQVAKLKLETLGIKIDTMTPEQLKYMNSWDVGTI